MSVKRIVLVLLLAALGAAGYKLFAHCQIPCGIYDDPARVAELSEHVATIEKSMNEIHRLSKEETINYNQVVRWVNNKEHHADELSEIVTYYFMAQRIKPADPSNQADYNKYIRELTLLHQMMIQAMKAKQTLELDHVKKLGELVKEFKASYLAE